MISVPLLGCPPKVVPTYKPPRCTVTWTAEDIEQLAVLIGLTEYETMRVQRKIAEYRKHCRANNAYLDEIED